MLAFFGAVFLDFIFWQGKEFSLVQNRPDRFWGTPSHLFRVYWGSFPEINLTNHLYLMPRLNMGGAVLFLPLYAFTFWKGATLLYSTLLYFTGLRGGAIGQGTALQSGKFRFRIPMESLEFFIYIILPAALRLWGRLSL